MTAWQKQAPGSASPTGAVTNGVEAGPERTCHFSWEEWFRHAHPHQRTEALALAQRQGVLYFQQLSPATNGIKPVEVAAETGVGVTLSRLLAGKTDALARPSLQPLTFADLDLDEIQQQAVRRALATPDVFLLQGLPGTGKSRVTVEILNQAASRGWRVLFLASHPASLDVVLQQLAGRAEVCPIRFLGPAEKLESLPAAIRSLTLEEQRQSFVKRVLVGARNHRDQAEACCSKRREEGALWQKLETCLGRWTDLGERLNELELRRVQLPNMVEQDAASPASALGVNLNLLSQALQQKFHENAASLKDCETKLGEIELKIADLSRKIAALEPGYRAKKENRFWTWVYLKNLANGLLIQEMESLQAQLLDVQRQQQDVTTAIADLHEQRRMAQAHYDSERESALRTDLEDRQNGLLQEKLLIEKERQTCLDEWKQLGHCLCLEGMETTAAALASAFETWQTQRKIDEDQCRFAQQWTDFVEQAGPQFAVRLPMLANVLAGTLAAWQKDPAFQEALKGAELFDLLVIDDADTLTDSDLLRVARKAQRCTLIANSCAEITQSPKKVEKMPRSFAATPIISALCWPRLWQTLGGDEGATSYSWTREEGRLTCQLHPCAKEDQQYLNSEGLADAAEIVLRILHRPKATPCLAQVIFPPDWTFQQAFSFIVREAQEIPLRPLCRTGWWEEDHDRIAWLTAPSDLPKHSWLDLDAGIRLGTVADRGDAIRIACIEFDKSGGWDEARARVWLERYRSTPDYERTMFLQAPHRFADRLTDTVVRLVCADHWVHESEAKNPDETISFEFCPVPNKNHHDAPKDGAGLEADLSAGRHADRLPSSLRQGLPARGYVNYLEGQSLVRRLESLVQLGDIGSSEHVAVLALYQSQVELLRRLIQQSELLRSCSVHVEVCLPSQMHQRECDIAFLSLTRSHSHRCVAFGDDASELPIALTRARGRLFVFGDVGTLSKRSHWHGPLDQLDAHSSHQEQLRLSRLLSCVRQQKEPLLVAGARE